LYTLISKEDIERIHSATIEVLEKTGVLIGNEKILDLLDDAGAQVDKKRNIAKIPESLVTACLQKVPDSFNLYSRTGEKHVIGGESLIIASGAGATWMLDLETGEPRPATKKDVEETSRLTDALEHFDLCMATAIPQDVNSTVVDVMAAEAMMINTRKPYFVAPGNGKQARQIIEMAAVIAGGMDELKKKPILLGVASPNSPLRLASHDLDVVSEFAKYKLPITILNCAISGATSPVTLAGTLVTTFAEILSMTVVAELINPGNPVLLGFCPVCIDMRTANAAFGCPENALVSVAGTQILRYYNVPSWTCASEVDAIVPDAQAGYETVWKTLLPIMAGVNVISGTGHLGAAAGGSFEKLVMDNEIIGAIKRILKGIEVTDKTLAVDIINAVGPGGHYLAQKYTREHLKNEIWFPTISYKSNVEEWKEEKGDLRKTAREKAVEILRTHYPKRLEKEEIGMSVKVYYDEDADLSFVKKEVVAIIGYGNQGRSQSLNLRDSGVNVVVGNIEDSYYDQAVKDGFTVHTIGEAAKQGSIICIMLPDEIQKDVYEKEIQQHVTKGKMLLFISGYSVRFGFIIPPKDVDVVDIFPTTYGEHVRERFLKKQAAGGFMAIGQDATGKAKQRSLSFAKASGFTSGGVFEMTFAQEIEINLMLEQILYPALMRIIVLAFETMVEAGYPPEIVLHELYMGKGPAAVFTSFSDIGFFKVMKLWSTTAQYGTLTRGPRIIKDDIKEIMKEHLREIQSGAFAREWDLEMSKGYPVFKKLWEENLKHPMNEVEERIRKLIRKDDT
jgi:trimethylamine--corrinoid protein Co-methyltransferase